MESARWPGSSLQTGAGTRSGRERTRQGSRRGLRSAPLRARVPGRHLPALATWGRGRGFPAPQEPGPFGSSCSHFGSRGHLPAAWPRNQHTESRASHALSSPCPLPSVPGMVTRADHGHRRVRPTPSLASVCGPWGVAPRLPRAGGRGRGLSGSHEEAGAEPQRVCHHLPRGAGAWILKHNPGQDTANRQRMGLRPGEPGREAPRGAGSSRQSRGEALGRRRLSRVPGSQPRRAALVRTRDCAPAWCRGP